MDDPKKSSSKSFVYLLMLVVVLAFLYVGTRTATVALHATKWHEITYSVIFLMAELFGLVHSVNYLLSMYFQPLQTADAKRSSIEKKTPLPPLSSYPAVAVVVPSYKEPISILKETLLCFYNLSYPNKYLYLLDDTRYDRSFKNVEEQKKYKNELEELCAWIGVNVFRRKWRGAKAGIINDFLQFRNGADFESLEYLPFQSKQAEKREPYIAIFDADMNPFPHFLDDLIKEMEENPKAAFIQTPQYYSNFENNRVARASGLQQVIFFEYICEHKGLHNAMFCCGSNVILRVAALDSVDGLDEQSVTEDFTTSLSLHLKSWDSIYHNKILAFGLGPEDLGAFFKQQFRWALGTLELGRKLPYKMIKYGRHLPFKTWIEYAISASHYLTGCFYLTMYLFPILYIFFDVPTFFLSPSLIVAILLPYTVLSLYLVAKSLNLRNYKSFYLLDVILISGITCPVYVKAAFYAFFGKKGSFVVTPKDNCSPLSLRELWPQCFLLLLSIAAITWDISRIIYAGQPIIALLLNGWWCLYNAVILLSLFHYNNPKGVPWIRFS